MTDYPWKRIEEETKNFVELIEKLQSCNERYVLDESSPIKHSCDTVRLASIETLTNKTLEWKRELLTSLPILEKIWYCLSYGFQEHVYVLVEFIVNRALKAYLDDSERLDKTMMPSLGSILRCTKEVERAIADMQKIMTQIAEEFPSGTCTCKSKKDST